MREWDLVTASLNWIRRRPNLLAIIWLTLLVTGIVLTVSASLTETRFLELRAFEGTVPPSRRIARPRPYRRPLTRD